MPNVLPPLEIAFASSRSGDDYHKDIWIMDADGSDQRRLTEDPGDEDQPSLSPDGTRIVFGSNADFELHRMNTDGTGLTQLTESGDGSSGQPDWSPDGTRIAFSSDRESAGYAAQIYVMNEDGTAAGRITDLVPGTWDQGPAWSQDGARIAFKRLDQNGWQIWVMNADGTGQTRLTEGLDTADPDWSPDGTKLVFQCNRQICIMNADGSNLTQITSGPPEHWGPSWSPAGDRIAYSDPEPDGDWEIYLMRPDGSEKVRLTYAPGFDGNAAWSGIPDRDGDGVLDDADSCQRSVLTPTVILGACDSDVPNTLLPTGCTITDLVLECWTSAHNRGEFVGCVAHLTNNLVRESIITGIEKGRIQRCAARLKSLISSSELQEFSKSTQ